MTIRTLLIPAAAVALLAAVITSPAVAGSPSNYPTPVSFLRAVQLPGAAIPAGDYVFERANPESSNVAVLIRNKRGTVQWLGLTNLVERPAGRATLIQMSEAAAGEAPRVLAWFPTDSTRGHAFIY